jgi:ParB family transcriptional regulator, chromosome partitioning protein
MPRTVSGPRIASSKGLGVRWLEPKCLIASPLSLSIYGDPSTNLDGLKESIREQGILVPLVVASGDVRGTWEILSGHRRWTCAVELGLSQIPCEVREIQAEAVRRRLVLEYNRQRHKSFSQLMREADVLEEFMLDEARERSLANLHHRTGRLPALAFKSTLAECRNSDDRDSSSPATRDNVRKELHKGRTDVIIARQLELGGKDLYRQARAIWRMAHQGDIRARNGVAQLDAGTKTIHAAYKDLRRRNRFTTNFRPTPYDVWAFRHDRAFGIPHPGSIPPAIVAHALHYFCPPGGLVVDPMAGGGTTLDVCQSMGRRCFAYDLEPSRPDIHYHDIRTGFPAETISCDLIFCDPPYHTMLAQSYGADSIATASYREWIVFLHELARHAFATLRPGGYLALLLAPQTEKDLPAGYGYLDHAFLGYTAALRAGFLPERRISCPMDGGYLPQHVRRARVEGRMLGQVRDLLVVRRPSRPGENSRMRALLVQADVECA